MRNTDGFHYAKEAITLAYSFIIPTIVVHDAGASTYNKGLGKVVYDAVISQ